jgi:hypothetical protein
MSTPGSQAIANQRGGHRQPAARVLLAVCAIAVAQTCLVLLFAWSSSRSAPHSLPIAVAGPPSAAQALAQGVERAQPGTFTVTVLADDVAARRAVTDRTVYGAVSLSATGATLYTAPAASSAVADALSQTVPAALKRALPGATVTVTTLVANPPDDPHGSSIPSALIPLTLTSIAAGAVIGLLAWTRRTRLVAIVLYAALAGVLATLSLQTVLGGLTGSWWSNCAVIALAALAISAATAGLVAVAHIVGVVISALFVFFVGFPFSGATTAWQLVPTPWGQLAQYLPISATNTALRSVAFFDGAAATAPLTVLAIWAVAGLGLLLVVHRKPSITS